MGPLSVPWRRSAATAATAVLAVGALAGCRAGVQVPPSSGQGGPGLNASGEQRSFTGDELVGTAAAAKTALRLGGAVLDAPQLAAQKEAAVQGLFTDTSPAACAALTVTSTPAGLDRAAAALVVAPSDSHAQHTAVGLKSRATPEEASAEVAALAKAAAACGRYQASFGGLRVPVTAAAADPGADAQEAVMVTSTAQVPDGSGGTPQERTVVRALAAKGTVVVEVLLVDAQADDAAATVRGYIDMALARLPL
ncbi:hypothetical protein SA2016_1639 [Sinomonas atrocyanea]|uniref:PknH-like extracellular domain-containing protein n=1 Tax=Sinomonas atrocyanea TaxID=37927 RepID=A0A127A108_9MICC|nr:hypothetical protein [Sinomonas atrocyanea]AMM32315.1 hypothetical protein SA2016_1639 [Sinomonas atrocyanea]